MLKTAIRKVSMVLVILLALITYGCGVGGVSKKQTMEIPDLGISMKIPSGWVLDDPGLCHRGEFNTGTLLQEPLNGKKFEDAAHDMSKEFKAEIVSRKKMQIDGYSAIRTHIKLPNGMHALRVYIHKKDKIITASFAIESKNVYSKYEQSLLNAMDSIKIK